MSLVDPCLIPAVGQFRSAFCCTSVYVKQTDFGSSKLCHKRLHRGGKPHLVFKETSYSTLKKLQCAKHEGHLQVIKYLLLSRQLSGSPSVQQEHQLLAVVAQFSPGFELSALAAHNYSKGSMDGSSVSATQIKTQCPKREQFNQAQFSKVCLRITGANQNSS